MSKVILTGFKPFGSYQFNPTEDLAQAFNGKKIGDHEIIGIVLECTYDAFEKTLKGVIETHYPAAIISTGLSSSVKGVRIETVGKNIMRGKYPDAEGRNPEGEKLSLDGRQFLEAQSDGVSLANVLYTHEIPTELSSDADGFVCNALLYRTIEYILTQHRASMRNTFIHIPWTDDYKGRVNLEEGKIMTPKADVHRAIELLIQHICD